MEDELSLEALLARENIRDCLLRYCRGVDRCDVELIRSAFHPDAHDDHGHFDGRSWELAEKLVESKSDGTEFTVHLTGSPYVELTSDSTAVVETYVMATQRANDEERVRLFVGRYLDYFERRESAWRIARRRIVHDWSGYLSVDPLSQDMSLYANGARGEDDPLVAFRADPTATRAGRDRAGTSVSW